MRALVSACHAVLITRSTRCVHSLCGIHGQQKVLNYCRTNMPLIRQVGIKYTADMLAVLEASKPTVSFAVAIHLNVHKMCLEKPPTVLQYLAVRTSITFDTNRTPVFFYSIFPYISFALALPAV